MFRRITIVLALAMVILNANLIALANEKQSNQYDIYYKVIYNHIASRSPMGMEWSAWITKSILHYSGEYKMDPLLVTALFHQESGFDMAARSRTGAVGIAQLQPTTAAGMGFDPVDPAQNIECGVKYLATQLSRFSYSGNWAPTYAIAAYNAGPEAVVKYRGIPPYIETQNHVNRVADIYRQLQKAMGHS